jgi:putative ABC transport system ATP-binding protein
MSISLNNLSFYYPETPSHKILDIREWTVPDNKHVFVYGASGCGKSTLLNLVSGMLPASEGEVTVLGQRLDKMSRRQRDQFRANHIGYVFQQFNLIPYLDAMDNIRLARHFSKDRKTKNIESDIQELLSSLNISANDWHKPAAKLSIGQQQRVAIARALINKPELLIADEPTSSLDQNNRDNFMSVLMSLVESHNTSLLFVSHDMTLSSYFDRIDALSEFNLSGELN